MATNFQTLNLTTMAFLAVFGLLSPSAATESELDALFSRLQQDELPEWEDVQRQIWEIWSRSGSDSMDLLLARGREALEGEDYQAAIEHFTALTDHAPNFAEGYNMRATAYFHTGLYGPALLDIERALALNPRHYGAMIGLGTIMLELGHEKEALHAYRQAIALNPHREDLFDLIDRLGPRHDGVDL